MKKRLNLRAVLLLLLLLLLCDCMRRGCRQVLSWIYLIHRAIVDVYGELSVHGIHAYWSPNSLRIDCYKNMSCLPYKRRFCKIRQFDITL